LSEYSGGFFFIDWSTEGVPVETPSATCVREWTTINGAPAVKLTAGVANAPAAGRATDTIRIRLPWMTDWVMSTSVTVLVPTTGMPSGGWIGTCEVTRTLTAAAAGTGDNSWRTSDLLAYEGTTKDQAPLQGFAVTGGVGSGLWWAVTKGAVAPVGSAVSGGASLTAPAVANPPASAAGAVVVAGAALGWTVGGLIAGGYTKVTGNGGSEWYCRWNPGYRVANPSLCSSFMDVPQVVTGTQLTGPDGVVIDPRTTATQWQTATAQAKVVIDTLIPDRGTVGVTGTKVAPVLSPAQTADISGATTANPPPPAPTSADPIYTGGEDDGSGCWSWNPLSWFKGLGCFAKWLFLPTQATLDALVDMWDGIKTKTPFTFITVIQWPGIQVQAAADAVSARSAAANPEDCWSFPRKLADGTVEGTPVLCAGGTVAGLGAAARTAQVWALYIFCGLTVFQLGRKALER
jgi:hypothetical protein